MVDIPEVDASQVPARIDVGTGEVESLRITSLARADGRNLARLEVRLASLVPYQIFSKDKDLNLVFERAATAEAPPESAATRSKCDRCTWWTVSGQRRPHRSSSRYKRRRRN